MVRERRSNVRDTSVLKERTTEDVGVTDRVLSSSHFYTTYVLKFLVGTGNGSGTRSDVGGKGTYDTVGGYDPRATGQNGVGPSKDGRRFHSMNFTLKLVY